MLKEPTSDYSSVFEIYYHNTYWTCLATRAAPWTSAETLPISPSYSDSLQAADKPLPLHPITVLTNTI